MTTHFGFKTIPLSEKQPKIDAVFNSVAHQYDLMNDLMSLGTHRLWKKAAIKEANLRLGHTVLDLAGGTGDMAARIIPKIGPTGRVILADINHAMLNVGRARLIDQGLVENLHFIQTNAEILPFANQSFDRITLAFGIRNFPDKSKALRELYRVLKPGGHLVILEFSPTPTHFSTLYELYTFNVLPWMGKHIVQDQNSYDYLAQSIKMHPTPEVFKALILEAGFDDCKIKTQSFGIVAIHNAYKY